MMRYTRRLLCTLTILTMGVTSRGSEITLNEALNYPVSLLDVQPGMGYNSRTKRIYNTRIVYKGALAALGLIEQKTPQKNEGWTINNAYSARSAEAESHAVTAEVSGGLPGIVAVSASANASWGCASENLCNTLNMTSGSTVHTAGWKLAQSNWTKAQMEDVYSNCVPGFQEALANVANATNATDYVDARDELYDDFGDCLIVETNEFSTGAVTAVIKLTSEIESNFLDAGGSAGVAGKYGGASASYQNAFENSKSASELNATYRAACIPANGSMKGLVASAVNQRDGVEGFLDGSVSASFVSCETNPCVKPEYTKKDTVPLPTGKQISAVLAERQTKINLMKRYNEDNPSEKIEFDPKDKLQVNEAWDLYIAAMGGSDVADANKYDIAGGVNKAALACVTPTSIDALVKEINTAALNHGNVQVTDEERQYGTGSFKYVPLAVLFPNIFYREAEVSALQSNCSARLAHVVRTQYQLNQLVQYINYMRDMFGPNGVTSGVSFSSDFWFDLDKHLIGGINDYNALVVKRIKDLQKKALTHKDTDEHYKKLIIDAENVLINKLNSAADSLCYDVYKLWTDHYSWWNNAMNGFVLEFNAGEGKSAIPTCGTSNKYLGLMLYDRLTEFSYRKVINKALRWYPVMYDYKGQIKVGVGAVIPTQWITSHSTFGEFPGRSHEPAMKFVGSVLSSSMPNQDSDMDENNSRMVVLDKYQRKKDYYENIRYYSSCVFDREKSGSYCKPFFDSDGKQLWYHLNWNAHNFWDTAYLLHITTGDIIKRPDAKDSSWANNYPGHSDTLLFSVMMHDLTVGQRKKVYGSLSTGYRLWWIPDEYDCNTFDSLDGDVLLQGRITDRLTQVMIDNLSYIDGNKSNLLDIKVSNSIIERESK